MNVLCLIILNGRANHADFKSRLIEIWVITATPAGVECTCPFFRQCKHALGIKIMRKEIIVRPEAKNIPLGQKRKRGRPAKAKKALIVQ